MNIVFPPVDDHFIKSKVDNGFYTNATELVRDAVRRLREQDDTRHARLSAALEAGEQAVREGRTEAYTPELMTQIMVEAHEFAANGGIPNPDICP